MGYRTGFRNCNHVAVADGPGQRNSGSWATARCGNGRERGIPKQAGTGPAERRIGHHRHAVPLAPGQQALFNAPIAEIVRDLISRAAIAVRNTKQVFHVADFEVGDAPGPNLSCRAQIFKSRDDAGEIADSIAPVQEIEVEVVGTEAREACRASTRDAVALDVS